MTTIIPPDIHPSAVLFFNRPTKPGWYWFFGPSKRKLLLLLWTGARSLAEVSARVMLVRVGLFLHGEEISPYTKIGKQQWDNELIPVILTPNFSPKLQDIPPQCMWGREPLTPYAPPAFLAERDEKEKQHLPAQAIYNAAAAFALKTTRNEIARRLQAGETDIFHLADATRNKAE